jgi:hypothetical protein
MNLLVNEPPRRPGQPLCQDPWRPKSGLRRSGAIAVLRPCRSGSWPNAIRFTGVRCGRRWRPEGLNSRIQAIRVSARGYRNREHFKT